MAAPPDASKGPTEPGPESPTTARPLEMDDDDVQETGILTTDQGAAAKPASTQPATAPATQGEEAPPPKPPRPMTEQQKNEHILSEAFPGVELGVIKAVLTASGGRIEPAFNALLEMTDPDAVQHEAPPPKPPRPVQEAVPLGSTSQAQLEADEQYARQLAQHYENVGAYEARTSNRSGHGYAPRTSSRQQRAAAADADGDRDHSFLDDDLPAIREGLRKGFVDTQNKFNSWITTVKKRIDEEWNDEGQSSQHQQQPGHEPFMGRPSRGGQRRSGDYDRYDADPELLSDDFAGIRLHSDGTPVRDQRPANPNLFKPPPPSTSPKPGGDRKVAFRDDVEDIDMYNSSPKLPPKDGPTAGAAGAKASKWQPLSSIDPSPIAENDPFSLGDSEDEKDGPGATPKKGDAKLNDAERLRQAAAEAMNDSLVDDKPKAGAAETKKE